MSKSPDNVVKLSSKTLSLCEYKSGGDKGFWLYDRTQGMNLSIRAETERDAFVEAIFYYQNKLKSVESQLSCLQTKVAAFVEQFAEDNGDDNG